MILELEFVYMSPGGLHSDPVDLGGAMEAGGLWDQEDREGKAWVGDRPSPQILRM